MGTVLAAEIACGQRAENCEIGFALIATALNSVDAAMSVYHDSEITRINQMAGTDVFLQPISSETESVLRAALTVSRKSGGAFDITIKPLADLYGFYQKGGGTAAALPTQAELSRTVALIGYHDLVVEPGRAGLKRQGMQIDLGGIAKGFALDRAAAALIKAGYTKFTFNFGGQILAHGMPVPVTVQHPFNPAEILLRCEISSGSISVSAQSERYRTAHGKRFGHLLNPRTGKSEENNLVAVVYHPQAMLADAWSTALFFADATEFRRTTAQNSITAYRFSADAKVHWSNNMNKANPCKTAR